MEIKYWVKGRPATFATNHEKKWKENIKNTIGQNDNINNCVEFCFQISPLNFSNYAFDVDNLCEPVFAVLTSELGWYGKKRTNIKKYRANKAISNDEGLLIIDNEGCNEISVNQNLVFNEVYTGLFPNKATDPQVIEWLQSLNINVVVKNECSLRLEYGSGKLSIATISSGKVKPLIDSLFPIIGGKIGDPDDHKITELLVEKYVKDLKENQVRITIWTK